MAKKSGVIKVLRFGQRTLEQLTFGEVAARPELRAIGMPTIIERKNELYDFLEFVDHNGVELKEDEAMREAVAYVVGFSRASPLLIEIARGVAAGKIKPNDPIVTFYIPVQFYGRRRK